MPCCSLSLTTTDSSTSELTNSFSSYPQNTHCFHFTPSPMASDLGAQQINNDTHTLSHSHDFGSVPHPLLISKDLRPTTVEERTYSWLDMTSLWVGMIVGVPSYYLAGSLVDLGMAWWQGVATVVAGNTITVVVLILMGHPGTRYGIPFPVLARSSFGIHGAHIPTLLRSLVGCGWYGIETWIGGQAIFLLLPETIKRSSYSLLLPWLGTSPLEFACFLVFWFAQLATVWNGMDGIRKLEKYSAPILVFLTSWLLVWSYIKARGFGHMLSLPSRLSPMEFWSLFFPSLTANIGSWSTLALNIPDFTRYAKTQKDQIIGQIGLPIFKGAFAFVGVAITSSTAVIFGRVISNPIQLLGEIGGFTTMVLAIFGLSLATITTNIPANVVATANTLVNLSPSIFNFKRGSVVTAILSIAFQPWRLLRSSESYVYTWLVGYSALSGPIGGILLTDYYIIRRKELSIKDLYSTSPGGAYYYSGGFNLVAVAALVVGMLPVIPGLLEKLGIVSSVGYVFVIIYNNSWFVSFFTAGLCNWGLSVFFPTHSASVQSQSQEPFLCFKAP